MPIIKKMQPKTSNIQMLPEATVFNFDPKLCEQIELSALILKNKLLLGVDVPDFK